MRQEVVEAIRTMPWRPAELGRLECRKDYPFDTVWNGVRYGTKQVRPIFVEEPDEIGAYGLLRGVARLTRTRVVFCSALTLTR